MKAIVTDRYGPPDVLRLKDVEKPAPKDDTVLVKVHAAAVNAYDWHLLTADIFLVRLMGGGLLKPKYTRLGADLRGGLKRLAKTSRSFSQAMRCSVISLHAVMALLPSMYLFPKVHWR